jgi:hypothetical protein
MSLGTEKQPKQKLTLAIDKKIIEKAKNAGINISSITEKVLESVTFNVRGATREDIVEGYERFFEVIRNVLRKYNARMFVGIEQLWKEDGEPCGVDIELNSNGLWADGLEGDTRHSVKIEDEVGYGLYGPFKILENLLRSLIAASEENREMLKELEIAMRFVKALPKDGNQSE